MKIIDAHLHLFSEDSAEEMARQVGHHNNVDHLREVYGELHIAHGVVMGNHSLELRRHDYPTDLFHYCVGLDSSLLEDGSRVIPDLPDRVEAHLRRDSCCGVKLYPGYNKIALSDPMYQPIYRLAARYGKPVAVHMGLTAFSRAHLKYCHPWPWMRWRQTIRIPSSLCATSATPFWRPRRQWWRKIPMWPPTCPAFWRGGWTWTPISGSRRATCSCCAPG